jgi:hypothetical protein
MLVSSSGGLLAGVEKISPEDLQWVRVEELLAVGRE